MRAHQILEPISTSRKTCIAFGCGFLLGLYLTYLHNRESVLESRADFYYKEYKFSQFYKNHEAYLQGSNPFHVDTTFNRIVQAFPDEHQFSDDIEHNIIQFYKFRYEDDVNNFPYAEQAEGWKTMNPEHNYTFFTNKELDTLVQETFEFVVPEVWEAYRLLPRIVHQSDLAKYITLYLFGGLYTDLDTECKMPIRSWFHNRFNANSKARINYIAGIEGENRDNFEEDLNNMRVQLALWSLMARSRHPALAFAMAKIVKITFESLSTNRIYDTKETKSMSVLDWTGPHLLTRATNEYISKKVIPLEIVDLSVHRNIARERLHGPSEAHFFDWRFTSGITQPVVAGDMAILPEMSFRSPELDTCPDLSLCFLTHLYFGSWKGDNSDF